jgi:uncharacterized damage-inducible protein DinB
MADRNQIVYMLKMNTDTIKPLIDDINEEESMERGNHQLSHIRWLTGHLVCTYNTIQSLMGEEKTENDELKKLFDFGVEISDDPALYPSMSDLRKELFEVQKVVVEAVQNAPEAVFDKEMEWFGSQIPVGHMLSFLCMHNFYHCGQITIIRKILGRPRPFA